MTDIQARIEKAQENLAVATWANENGYTNACANRAYYAAFQIAIAALVHFRVIGANQSISHEAAQANFSAHLIRKRKVFSGQFKSYLMDLQKIRDIADYKVHSVSKKDAAKQLKQAKLFVDTVCKEISHAQS